MQVFGTSDNTVTATTNLALSGSASQSSTAYGGNASRAIDNNTNGAWKVNSVTHTANENDAWWEVELQESSNIDNIVLFNRTNSCCVSRLSNFSVSVLNESRTTVFAQNYNNPPTPSLSINTNGITGRYVRVHLNQKNPLSLAEVQVFGTPNPNFANANLRQSGVNKLNIRREAGQKVGLDWVVDESSKPIQFEVEYRNQDYDYETLEIITPMITSGNNVYQYIHDFPRGGDNTYRVKVLYSDYTVIYLDPRTINFREDAESRLFPNPTADIIYLKLFDYENTPVKVSITDLTGKVYHVAEYTENHLPIEEIDLSNFRNGMYVIYIQAKNKRIATEKVSLMRTY